MEVLILLKSFFPPQKTCLLQSGRWDRDKGPAPILLPGGLTERGRAQKHPPARGNLDEESAEGAQIGPVSPRLFLP